MLDSKSTDKLKILTDLAKSISDKIESCESIKVNWIVLETEEEDVVVPNVEIIGLKIKNK